MSTTGPAFDDEDLTAHLDGELGGDAGVRIDAALREDMALRARLDMLERGRQRGVAEMADLLDAAPRARLEDRLAAALDDRRAPRRAVAPGPARFGRLPAMAVAASLVFAFLAGVLADRTIDRLAPADTRTAGVVQGGWREIVAVYFELYTPRSFAAATDDAADRAEALTAIGEALGVSLAPDRLALREAELRQAQLLEYEGKPLAFLAYLGAGDDPMAYCLIRNGRPDADLSEETRHGFNIVHWTEGGVGHLLIGRASTETLTTRANTLRTDL